ncbi:MAG TPA: hypothetical protein VGE01_10485 [Fimbriimonas sp.]
MLAIVGALWGWVCLNLFTLVMSSVAHTGGPFTREWQVPVLFTSAATVLVFRMEIATKTGWSAFGSSVKIAYIHVALYLLVLASYTVVASGGSLLGNAGSLVVYGFFYALLFSPILILLGAASQYLMRPVARWAGGLGA